MIIRSSAQRLTVLTAILFLAACQEGSSPPSTSAPPELLARDDNPQQSEVPNGSARVVVGTYIDPETMAVGGMNVLSTSDRLFAGVAFPPVAGGTGIVAKIIDKDGVELARKHYVVRDISQTSVNFDFGTPGDVGLPTGNYNIQIEIGTGLAHTTEFAVR